MNSLLVLSLVVILILSLYIIHVNISLSSVPEEVHKISPKRYDSDTIYKTYERLLKEPITMKLPPKTGRRYIVVGGAGFLPSWIVLQLLERGEDPKRIRIIDLRAPMRQDLTTGKAAEVSFKQADVSSSEAVMAAFTAPWEDGKDGYVSTTVFHSAANIRFWERVEYLMPWSNRVNLTGTQNVLAACRAIGANILVYTSSGSILTKSNNFWVKPWNRFPKHYVQVLDDSSPIPTKHSDFFSNYAASKASAERIIRNAHKTKLPQGGLLRTGCIRPGSGVFGPGGDMLAGAYLVQKVNPTWVGHIIQSYVYVENCALAHLLYEQRLLELASGSSNPDIGGQAFSVSDPNPPIAFNDVYRVLRTLNPGIKFIFLPPALMLLAAQLLEGYYLFRFWHPLLSRVFPEVKPPGAFLQPALFNLTQVHLIFDDCQARKPPKDGGLGYQPPYTTLEGLCKLNIEWKREGRREQEAKVIGGRLSYGAGLEINWIEK